MPDNGQLSAKPHTSQRRYRETESLMIDSVRVAPDTFASLTFLGSSERKEFVQGQNIPYNQKKQQVKDGVPVWTVQLAVSTWRNAQRARVIKVNIPCQEDPGQRFGTGELVELQNAVYGVTPNREGNGYAIWMTAEGIVLATASVGRPVGASA
jgi:hypothetical protein